MHKITKTFFKVMRVPTREMAVRDEECWKKYNMEASIIDPEKIGRPLTRILRNKKQENFLAITMDASNHILNVWKITEGLANQTPAHPRECFLPIIKDSATAVIFAHNHPSGCTDPSDQDWAITRTLCAAGKILMIPVLDHLVIGKWNFSSMCRRDPSIFEQTCQKLT